MKAKKILAVGLAAVMCVSLAGLTACNSSAEKEEEQDYEELEEAPANSVDNAEAAVEEVDDASGETK